MELGVSEEDQKEALNKARTFVHECLSENPVIVLGSGASIGQGLPSMGDLAHQIISEIGNKNWAGAEADQWNKVHESLDAGVGLEAALDKAGLDERTDLFCSIIDAVWHKVSLHDIATFEKVRMLHSLPHTALFQYMLRSHHRRITVVTTNYDRLAEYGADQAGYYWRTGFSTGYFRRWVGLGTASRLYRTDRIEERTVDILKVHGSIDWFTDDPGNLSALPLAARTSDNVEIPPGMRPVIVPPAATKYRQTFREPYRSTLAEADLAFVQASSFLCIGYGFNDEHVQEKLSSQLKSGNKKLILIVMELTDNAKKAINNTGLKYFTFTKGEESGTTLISSNDTPHGMNVEGLDLWSFDGFSKEML